jgi:hypothetical protein
MRDRRAAVRLPMKLPVLIGWETGSGRHRETQTNTVNLSSNGLLLLTPTRFRPYTPVRCLVFLSDAGAGVELLCRGRVVRHTGAGEFPGVAATIDEYELRRAPDEP